MAVIQLSNTIRPTFNITVNSTTLQCLYDTGADISVWEGSSEVFNALFPNAQLITNDYKITGFDGNGLVYSLYTIPIFNMVLSDGEYTIKNFIVAVNNNSCIDIDLILCAGVFSKSTVVLDKINGKLKMYVISERDDVMMLPAEEGTTTTVFSQAEQSTMSNLLNIANSANPNWR